MKNIIISVNRRPFDWCRSLVEGGVSRPEYTPATQGWSRTGFVHDRCWICLLSGGLPRMLWFVGAVQVSADHCECCLCVGNQTRMLHFGLGARKCMANRWFCGADIFLLMKPVMHVLPNMQFRRYAIYTVLIRSKLLNVCESNRGRTANEFRDNSGDYVESYSRMTFK